MYFVLKLIPSRPTFAQDMTDDERAIMGRHVAYWKTFMDKGSVVAFGPVLDPAGVYGLGIMEAETEDDIKEFIKNDPAAQINNYVYHQMMAVTPAK